MSKRKRHGHDDEHQGGHEEPWLISYADMMTLLFGFFVILYSFSQVDEKKLESFGKDMAKTLAGEDAGKGTESDFDSGMTQQEREARAFRLMATMMKLGTTAKEAVVRVEDAVKQAQDAKAAKDLVMQDLSRSETTRDLVGDLDRRARGEDATVDIVLPESMLFKPGKGELLPESLPRLREIAKALGKVDTLQEIQVVGHTDSAKSKVGPDNWSLSAMRAAAVVRELAGHGVDARRLRSSGMGDLQPMVPEKTRDGRWIPANMAKNRRVHIIVKKTANAH